MKTLTLFLLLAASALGATVDGVIVNGATGRPQPNATVSLFRTSQQGPELLTTVKSGPAGAFSFPAPEAARTPLLVQAVFEGVTYNQIIPPGRPTTGLTVQVFAASRQQGEVKVDQHMMLVEPSGGQLQVSESYILQNQGKTAWSDPAGVFHFAVPEGQSGPIQVSITTPGGLPIRRPAEKTKTAGVFTVPDFAVKPGQSQVDITYAMPFQSPGKFSEKVILKTPDTKLVVPIGVTVTGDQLQSLGKEPATGAALFKTTSQNLAFTIEGEGTLRGSAQDPADENAGPQLAQVLPKLYGMVSPADGPVASILAIKWIVLLILGILAIVFTMLFRRKTPPPAVKAPPPNARRA